MSVVIFLAVLVFLILVHEFGHFIAAKWAKMRVDEFAIGFPPRLFAWKKGETEYSINLLPIGGYVKIFGENGEDEVSYQDKARAFGARPRIQQAIVLIAGVAMNILTAWIIFFAIALMGTPTAVEESIATDKAELTVVSVLPNSPASEAEIPLGSVITSIETAGATPVLLTPSNLSNAINENPEGVSISYTHKGEGFETQLISREGVILEEPERKIVGLSTVLVETKQQNPFEAITSSAQLTGKYLYAITIGILTFFGSFFTMSADLSQVAGPIGIAGMVGEAAEVGIVSLLIFVAFISLNLAVINLLPIPALDGGRLVFVAIEAIIRRPINPEWVGRINLIGFLLLLLLMVVVTYSDIAKLF